MNLGRIPQRDKIFHRILNLGKISQRSNLFYKMESIIWAIPINIDYICFVYLKASFLP